MRQRDLEKLPIIVDGLSFAAFCLVTKLRLCACHRCGSIDISPYVENSRDHYFYVSCHKCRMRTCDWRTMKAAIWDWNGVWQRQVYKNGEWKTMKAQLDAGAQT